MRAPAAYAARTGGLERFISGLTTVFAITLTAVSPFALNAIGWNYDGVDGSPLTRFHPATLLAIVLVIAMHLRSGNPLASILDAFGRDLCLSIYLFVWAILLFHASVNQERPAAALIDTFLLPVLVILIYRGVNGGIREKLALLIHTVFFINALLGIAEFLTGWRLTPYYAGGILIDDDWRSSALLGHPLGNALMTGCYIALLILGAGKQLKGALHTGMIVLQFAAMVAFGGRASLVLLLLFALYGVARVMAGFLAGGRFRLGHVMAFAFALPLGLGVAGGLFELGFFDKFILRFIEDRGSAQARIVMFELFNGFTMTELMFGPPQSHLASLVRLYRLEFGIESLWVAFILYYGIIPSLIFFSGLAFFIASLMSECQKRIGFVLLYFFVVNTTFLGLGGKTPTFASLTLMLLCLAPHGLAQGSSTLSRYQGLSSRQSPHPC